MSLLEIYLPELKYLEGKREQSQGEEAEMHPQNERHLNLPPM